MYVRKLSMDKIRGSKLENWRILFNLGNILGINKKWKEKGRVGKREERKVEMEVSKMEN